uniref:DUF4283 domain-containing protein n=1 Tax=Cannabis sativa TaxID=3483 RepID=A0A803P112_CANSA
MIRVWNLEGRLEIKDLPDDLFLFTFHGEVDLEKVETNDPWNFKRTLLLLQRTDGLSYIDPSSFTTSPFWVRVLRVPFKVSKSDGKRPMEGPSANSIKTMKVTPSNEDAIMQNMEAKKVINNPTIMDLKKKEYYQELFTSIYPTMEHIQRITDYVPKLVFEEMNMTLLAHFTSNEVFQALNAIAGEKSPGEDSMSGMFYKQHWNIIGTSVTQAVLTMLNNPSHINKVNSTLITLIPKRSSPTLPSYF